MDDAAGAKEWFDKGKKLLSTVKASPLGSGFFGAVLVSEITEDIASVILDEMASDDHIFSLKQVDFLPVANTTGKQQQLLFCEGRYVVVAVPPESVYPMLKGKVEGYPDQIDIEWLEKNAGYRGGYLVEQVAKMNPDTGKEELSLRDYVYTPYVSFNFALMKRYADLSPVVEEFKKASRALDAGNLEGAKAALGAAVAGFMFDTGMTFKEAVKAEKPEAFEKGKKGMLEIEGPELLKIAKTVGDGILEKFGKKAKKVPFGLLLGVLDEAGDKTGEKAKETFDEELVAGGGIYTELEYSLFISLMKAIAARGRMLEQHPKPTPADVEPVLEKHLLVRQDNTNLPFFNSECEAVSRAVRSLWRRIKKTYCIPAKMRIEAGKEVAEMLCPGEEDKAQVFKTLLRLQKDVDWLNENCIEKKSKAH